MTTPKRIFGPSSGLFTAALALVLLVPLGYFAPVFGALALAAVALLAAFLLWRRASALSASHEKLSGEIDVLSRHLLKVEALAKAAAARVSAPPAAAPPETARLGAGLDDLTAEIGLLSGIVRELASVVAAQEGEIVRLKTEAPAPAARPQTQSKVEQTPGAADIPVPPAVPSKAVFRPPVVGTPAEYREIPKNAGEAQPFDRDREAAILESFDGEGLEVWLQPVVTLPQRKVVSYEASARLRVADAVLAPDAFLSVLERHGRTTALDRRMLARVATIARHLKGRGSPAAVAYALSPLSLFEPDFLRSLGSLAGNGPDLDGRLVLALPQASWRGLDPEQTGVLGALRGRLGFMLDRPTDLRFEAATLAGFGIDQVKVPAAMLLRPQEALSDIAAEDLVAALGRAGLKLVAAQVEREADVPDLIDLDIPLAQGAVFAASRAVRPEVLAGGVLAVAAEAPPVAAAAPREPDPGPQPPRRAFRDFLRRAV